MTKKEEYTLLSWESKDFTDKEISLMKELNEIFQDWNNNK